MKAVPSISIHGGGNGILKGIIKLTSFKKNVTNTIFT